MVEETCICMVVETCICCVLLWTDPSLYESDVYVPCFDRRSGLRLSGFMTEKDDSGPGPVNVWTGDLGKSVPRLCVPGQLNQRMPFWMGRASTVLEVSVFNKLCVIV